MVSHSPGPNMGLQSLRQFALCFEAGRCTPCGTNAQLTVDSIGIRIQTSGPPTLLCLKQAL